MAVRVELKPYTWASKTRKRMQTLSKNPRTQPWGKPCIEGEEKRRQKEIMWMKKIETHIENRKMEWLTSKVD